MDIFQRWVFILSIEVLLIAGLPHMVGKRAATRNKAAIVMVTRKHGKGGQ